MSNDLRIIWKYELVKRGTITGVMDEITLKNVPTDFKPLNVQIQNGFPVLWALVDPDSEKRDLKIRTIGTGHDIPYYDSLGEYVGTYQLHGGGLIFHVFTMKGE